MGKRSQVVQLMIFLSVFVLFLLNSSIVNIGLDLKNKSDLYKGISILLSFGFICFSQFIIDDLFPKRTRRMVYVLLMIIIVPILITCSYITFYNYKLATIYEYGIEKRLLIYWAVTIILFWTSLFLTLSRLQDTNHNGAVSLLLFVPIVNVLLMVILCFMAGTVGTNQYGEDPRQKGIPKPPTT